MLSKVYKMISIIIVELSILLSISADSVNWRDTGSLYKVEDVRVSSCNRTRCAVQRGGEYTIDVDFLSTIPADDLFFKITASKYGFTFPLLDGNLCDGQRETNGKFVHGECPVQKGERISYRYTAKVPDIVPAISGTVNARVFDGNNNVLIKISMDVEVIKSPSSPRFNLLSFFKSFRSAPEEPN